MNLVMFNALTPDDRLVINDHGAQTGAGADTAKTLHRMNEAILMPKLLAATFQLVRQYDVLRNPDDSLSVSVFDQQWQGKTDRLVYEFERPVASMTEASQGTMSNRQAIDVYYPLPWSLSRNCGDAAMIG